ncbi:unnamed protein product, partial [Chrysoparadoxa australica]
GAKGAAIAAPSVRVVEVTSRGTRVRNAKRFYVVNPTNVSYNFVWEPLGEPNPSWKCLTPRGMILAGKRGEMAFEFTPDDMSTAEAFYRFKISDHSVSELFLFVGQVAEPLVTLDLTRIHFGALMLGTLHRETFHVVNHEMLPYSFTIDKNSIGMLQGKDEGRHRPILSISPMSALLPPKGRVPVEVTFCPREEKFHNFNLVVNVRKKASPLNMNIKGEGYKVHAKLVLQAEDNDQAASNEPTGAGVATELVPLPAINTLDFGDVYINERAARTVMLANPGKFNVDYLWVKNNAPPVFNITGEKLGGSIKKGSKMDLALEFTPVTEVQLDGTELRCTIAGRYEYVIKVYGRGVKPGLAFDVLKHDFGPCFVTPPGQIPLPECKRLVVTNRDPSSSLSLDCTHQRARCLWVDFSPTVLEPGTSVEVPLCFAPREAKPYAFSVPFLVNGSYTVKVVVLGEGCPARLELLNPAQKHVNFGIVPEGGVVEKAVSVINRSKCPITFQLDDAEDLGIGKLQSCFISYNPRGTTTLAPRESTTISVAFSPTTRHPSFTETLWVKAGATPEPRPLIVISGQSTGMEVCLGVDAMPFGTVCEGSSKTMKVQFENRGDLPASFRWIEHSFGQHFRVEPLEGMIAPLSDMAFEVTFEPMVVDDDIRREGMQLSVDGSLLPLNLTCTGSCVVQPADSIHELAFSSRVRQPEAKSVSLSNPTDKQWYLAPVLKGEHWHGDSEIQVPAKGQASYEVVFLPSAMTTLDNQEEETGQSSGSKVKRPGQHEGSLFFALPDGAAVLYRLSGKAMEPLEAGTHSLSTAAKSALTFTVPVENWLRRSQQFSMSVKLAEGTDQSTSLTGAQTVEVPAHARKEFGLRFLAYKEGVTNATVTFTNEATGEYLYHTLELTSGEAEVQETITLEATVRNVIKHLITVENPLPSTTKITYAEDWWSCTSPYIRLRPLGSMTGNQEGTFELEYRPLLVTDGQHNLASLSFAIEQLGSYKCDLKLAAKAPPSKQVLHFEGSLGESIAESFTIRVFNTGAAAKFTSTVTKAEFFQVSESLTVEPTESWEGQDVCVQVSFVPEKPGKVHDTLTVTSPEYGVYQCELRGTCSPPLPQGPFTFAPGEQKELPFRNVFAANLDFTFTTDNSAFVVASGEKQTVPGKASKNAVIKFQPLPAGVEATAGGIVGKLIVQCVSMGQLPPWVFYLQGQPPAT